MKALIQLAFTLIILIAIRAAAAQIALPALAPSAFADTEASACAGIVIDPQSTLTATAIFEASPTNCVELVFGRDSNSDGELEWHEAALKIGWDAGEWIVSSPITGEGLSAPPRTATARKTLSVKARLRADGSASSVEVRENGMPILADAIALLPRSARLDFWNCLRETARGAPPGAAVCMATRRDGSIYHIR